MLRNYAHWNELSIADPAERMLFGFSDIDQAYCDAAIHQILYFARLNLKFHHS